MSTNMNALEQALAVLSNPTGSSAELRAAAGLVCGVVREIDAESESAPAIEATVLARMTSDGIQQTQKALIELDDESSHRALTRKVAVALGAALDERVRAIEAAEAAKPPEQRRREQEQARREAHLQELFARVPVLFRTDYMISAAGKSARSRTPRPVGSHVAYARDFTVQRVLGQNVMESMRVPGWPPRHGDYARIEWPNSEYDEIETITEPLRKLCHKSLISEEEVARAIERAQATLLGEFARVCSEIREQYPAGLPRSITLPSIGAHAMAAE